MFDINGTKEENNNHIKNVHRNINKELSYSDQFKEEKKVMENIIGDENE